MGSVIAVIGLVIIAVVAGIVVSNNHKKRSTLSSTNSPSSVVNQTNPSDPSTFTKDSRLKQSFYGLAYTPAGSQLPDCGSNLSECAVEYTRAYSLA